MGKKNSKTKNQTLGSKTFGTRWQTFVSCFLLKLARLWENNNNNWVDPITGRTGPTALKYLAVSRYRHQFTMIPLTSTGMPLGPFWSDFCLTGLSCVPDKLGPYVSSFEKLLCSRNHLILASNVRKYFLLIWKFFYHFVLFTFKICHFLIDSRQVYVNTMYHLTNKKINNIYKKENIN